MNHCGSLYDKLYNNLKMKRMKKVLNFFLGLVRSELSLESVIFSVLKIDLIL